MSANITSPKEIASLLRLVAAALDDPDSINEKERQELIEDCDRVAETIYNQN